MTILSLVREILIEVLKILREANSTPNQSTFTGEIMYIVKDDNPDVGFELAFVAKDSEGNEVPSDGLSVEITSDNEDAVAVNADETGRAGSIHFGAPGLANINVTVENDNGDLLGSFGAQFTVTTGDPASIMSGTLTFDGLTEAPAPAPEPTPEPIPEPAPEPAPEPTPEPPAEG
jgi:hypothetical protein